MNANNAVAVPDRAAMVTAGRLPTARLDAARRRLLLMHWRSGVGHLGANLSALDAMMLLHHEMIGPRDRFILSKGHAAGAYYVTLWSLGSLTDADLDSFHRDGTLLAGHPPARGLPGVLFSTGSLGHGLSLAAGLALAARLQGRAGQVFCLTSDGEWQEGSTFEALIFATHHRLSNLTILVDDNGLQGFGSTAEVASMDPLARRLAGFDVDLRACDGHSLTSLRSALSPPGDPQGDRPGSQSAGQGAGHGGGQGGGPGGGPGSGRPTLVIMRTIKGRGVPGLEHRIESHYLPLTDATYRAALDRLGPPHEPRRMIHPA